MNINEKIKNIRIAKKMTQEQLSTLSGISIQSIKKYEAGDRNPKTDQLQKIANAFGISINVFTDFEIRTVSDLLSMIFKMHEQTDMEIQADKDSQGNYIPETIKFSFRNQSINQKLCAYKAMMDRQQFLLNSSQDYEKNSKDEHISIIHNKVSKYTEKLLDDDTPLSPKLSENVIGANSLDEEIKDKTLPQENDLTTLLLDCSDKEVDFIIKTVAFLKKTLREQ